MWNALDDTKLNVQQASIKNCYKMANNVFRILTHQNGFN